MKLLLVEDETRMAEALLELLRQDGYTVDCYERGDVGLEALCSGQYDGAVVDVMLPGLDGFSLVAQSRQAGVRTPVLLLSARDGLDDKVTGLDAGADDYLTKPFQPRELLARVHALCRRGLPAMDGNLSFGDLTLDPGSLMLTCTASGESVRLGDKEYRLLEYLVINRGRILTREQLALRIWGYESEAEYNKVEVYVSFTRKKMAFVHSGVEIRAVRGVGYEMRWDHG